MKIFFETGSQACCFLIAVPVGFVLAICLDTDCSQGWLRFVLDLLILIVAACALIMLTMVCREEQVRLYHWLGLFTGSVLYMCGARKIRCCVKRQYQLLHSKIMISCRKKTFECRNIANTEERGDVPCAEP